MLEEFFHSITIQGLLTGIKSIFSSSEVLNNKLNKQYNASNFNYEVIVKKCLTDVPSLHNTSYSLEVSRISKENNINEKIYASLFKQILINICNDNNINVDVVDFIKKCYINISNNILSNNLIHSIIENNSSSNNLLINIIDACYYKSLYSFIDINKLLSTKPKTNDTQIIKIQESINKLTIQINSVYELVNNIYNNILQEKINGDNLDIPKIKIDNNTENIKNKNISKTSTMLNNIIVPNESDNKSLDIESHPAIGDDIINKSITPILKQDNNSPMINYPQQDNNSPMINYPQQDNNSPMINYPQQDNNSPMINYSKLENNNLQPGENNIINKQDENEEQDTQQIHEKNIDDLLKIL